MAKQGRGRRTAEQRLAAKDRRSSLGYALRIQKEVAKEQREKAMKEMMAEMGIEVDAEGNYTPLDPATADIEIPVEVAERFLDKVGAHVPPSNG